VRWRSLADLQAWRECFSESLSRDKVRVQAQGQGENREAVKDVFRTARTGPTRFSEAPTSLE